MPIKLYLLVCFSHMVRKTHAPERSGGRMWFWVLVLGFIVWDRFLANR